MRHLSSVFRLLAGAMVAAVALTSCGYHLGGVRNRALAKMDSVSISMFANHSLYPDVAMQLTTALGEELQRDGAYRILAPERADITISGTVTSVVSSGLRTNSRNTYLSTEIGLTVTASYTIVQNSTGKVLLSGRASAEGSYFNDETGNVQTARDSALSYATRQVAEKIVQNMTIP